MAEGRVHTIERGLDGTETEYHDMAVEGDGVERLLTELFTEHWAKLTVGPLIEGAAYEIQFASAPTVPTLDGYLTVDTGAWHFHLCVNAPRGARRLLADGRGLLRGDDVGTQALERSRRADDHDSVPEPALRRGLAAPP